MPADRHQSSSRSPPRCSAATGCPSRRGSVPPRPASRPSRSQPRCSISTRVAPSPPATNRISTSVASARSRRGATGRQAGGRLPGGDLAPLVLDAVSVRSKIRPPTRPSSTTARRRRGRVVGAATRCRCRRPHPRRRARASRRRRRRSAGGSIVDSARASAACSPRPGETGGARPRPARGTPARPRTPRLRGDRSAACPAARSADQPGVLEQPQVARHRGSADRRAAGDLAAPTCRRRRAGSGSLADLGRPAHRTRRWSR